MWVGVALKEGGLDGTGCPWVSKPKRNLCNFYPVRRDCFAPAGPCHIFANTAALGVLFWCSGPRCLSRDNPSPLLSDAAARPESKQRALDVLLAAGHFVWRSGPAFCRTQITRAICHREDLHHFPSDRRHFRMFQHVKKNKVILLNLIPNFGCEKCKISAFEPNRGETMASELVFRHTAGSLVQQEKGTPHFSRLGFESVQLK